MYTELEAGDKGCPHNNFCHASGCMAWRWGEQADRGWIAWNLYPRATDSMRPPPMAIDWEFMPYDPDNESYEAGWLEPVEMWMARRKGYCGLAGRP
jgi:hypothetical protein